MHVTMFTDLNNTNQVCLKKKKKISQDRASSKSRSAAHHRFLIFVSSPCSDLELNAILSVTSCAKGCQFVWKRYIFFTCLLTLGTPRWWLNLSWQYISFPVFNFWILKNEFSQSHLLDQGRRYNTNCDFVRL